MDKNIKAQRFGVIMQFFVFLIMSLLICAPPIINKSVYADEITARISAENQTVHRGQTFGVDINISENTGLLTLYLTLKFDHSVFSLVNVEQKTEALSTLNMEHTGGGFDSIDERTGGFNLLWDGGGVCDSSNGTIVTLTFEAPLNAPLGTYPIEIVARDSDVTIDYNVQANVEVTSPQITITEGAYIVVWHNDDQRTVVPNTNITGHPYNELTGGYEYSSEESLNFETDFPNNPTKPADKKYSYEFAGWKGAVWTGEVPSNSSVIYYVATYNYIPQKYDIDLYIDGYVVDVKDTQNNKPDGLINEDDEFWKPIKNVEYNSLLDEVLEMYSRDDFTFYGWYLDENFTQKVGSSTRMPAKENPNDDNFKLYGYVKWNIRDNPTEIPEVELLYRETITNSELEDYAYVDVFITKNTGLNALFLSLHYDKEIFTFNGVLNEDFERGEIFIPPEMSFITTGHEIESDAYNFSWYDASTNSYSIGRILVLKFKINKNAQPGAYEISMTCDTVHTTYRNESSEQWYSDVKIINTKIPIGSTNHWSVPMSSQTDESNLTIEADSEVDVSYNVEFVSILINDKMETKIDKDSLREVLTQNLMVYNLYDIYYERNHKRLTPEEFKELFGDTKIVVKIKLTTLQLRSKNLDIYYVDDDGIMHLYESKVENGYLVFETDHFSNWALIGDYVLTNVETTSARLLRISLLFFGISASAMISIAFVRNRKKQSLIVYQNNEKGGNES